MHEDEVLEKDIAKWIASLGVVLYGQYFGTNTQEDRMKAARWLAKQMRGFEAWQQATE